MAQIIDGLNLYIYIFLTNYKMTMHILNASFGYL